MPSTHSRPVNVRTSRGALTTNGVTNLLSPSFSKPAVRAQGGVYRDTAARLHGAGYAFRLHDTTQVVFGDRSGSDAAEDLTFPGMPEDGGHAIFSGGSSDRGAAVGGILELVAPNGASIRMPMQVVVGSYMHRPTRNRVLVTDVVGQLLRMLDENAYDELGEGATIEDYLDHVTR